MARKEMDVEINVEFEEASEKTDISSGENLPTLFGKIKKWISSFNSDIKALLVTDLDNIDETGVLRIKDISKEVLHRGTAHLSEYVKLTDSTTDYLLKGRVRNGKVHLCVFGDVIPEIDIPPWEVHTPWETECTVGMADNAFALDGKPASDFYFAHGDTSDCNTATLAGTYNAVPSTANTPSSSYWFISVENAANGAWIKQTAILCDPTIAPIIYERIYINGDWGDWAKVNDGGNADILDGHHATDFIYPRGIIDNVDLNEIKYPCSFLTYGNISNAPPVGNAWCTVFCVAGGTGSIIQILVPTANDGTQTTMWFRHYGGTGWTEWRNSADGGNADTLDGKHASDFGQIGAVMRPLRSMATDANTALSIGYYTCMPTTSNIPIAQYGVLEVFCQEPDIIDVASKWIYQRYEPVDNAQSYIRCNIWNAGWTDWHKVSDNGNAATVGGKSANDLLHFYNLKGVETSCLSDLANGLYWNNNWKDCPPQAADNQGMLMVINYEKTQAAYGWRKLIFYTPHNNRLYENVITGGTPNGWYDIADDGKASCVRTISETGASFGDAWLMSAQFNRAGDNSFRIFCGDGSTWTSVNLADHARFGGGAMFGYSSDTSCLRNLSSGTAAATTDNCPNGAWYGQYS